MLILYMTQTEFIESAGKVSLLQECNVAERCHVERLSWPKGNLLVLECPLTGKYHADLGSCLIAGLNDLIIPH